jgi:hypothetical protein
MELRKGAGVMARRAAGAAADAAGMVSALLVLGTSQIGCLQLAGAAADMGKMGQMLAWRLKHAMALWTLLLAVAEAGPTEQLTSAGRHQLQMQKVMGRLQGAARAAESGGGARLLQRKAARTGQRPVVQGVHATLPAQRLCRHSHGASHSPQQLRSRKHRLWAQLLKFSRHGSQAAAVLRLVGPGAEAALAALESKAMRQKPARSAAREGRRSRRRSKTRTQAKLPRMVAGRGHAATGVEADVATGAAAARRAALRTLTAARSLLQSGTSVAAGALRAVRTTALQQVRQRMRLSGALPQAVAATVASAALHSQSGRQPMAQALLLLRRARALAD